MSTTLTDNMAALLAFDQADAAKEQCIKDWPYKGRAEFATQEEHDAYRKVRNEALEPHIKAVKEAHDHIDLDALPVGTAVSWTRWLRYNNVHEKGIITQVTRKYYVITDQYRDTKTHRVPITTEGRSSSDVSGFCVWHGPSAVAASKQKEAQRKAILSKRNATYTAVAEAKGALNVLVHKRNEGLPMMLGDPVKNKADSIMRERYAEEWAALCEQIEAEMYAGKPTREQIAEARAAVEAAEAAHKAMEEQVKAELEAL